MSVAKILSTNVSELFFSYLFQWSNVITQKLKMQKKQLDLHLPIAIGTQSCLSVIQAIS